MAYKVVALWQNARCVCGRSGFDTRSSHDLENGFEKWPWKNNRLEKWYMLFPCLAFSTLGKSMGLKHAVLPDGPHPTIVFTVLAKMCGIKAIETEMGVTLGALRTDAFEAPAVLSEASSIFIIIVVGILPSACESIRFPIGCTSGNGCTAQPASGNPVGKWHRWKEELGNWRWNCWYFRHELLATIAVFSHEHPSASHTPLKFSSKLRPPSGCRETIYNPSYRNKQLHQEVTGKNYRKSSQYRKLGL